MKSLKFKFVIKELDLKSFDYSNLNNKKINIINVDFKHRKVFDKISTNPTIILKNHVISP